MTTLPRQQDTDYEPGDFLLIDKDGAIQAVSGNTDFWDCDETMPEVSTQDPFTIVKVMVTHTVDDNGTYWLKEYDYASEECPDCITKVNKPIPYEPGPRFWEGK